jgi:hypothetical protein
MDFARKAFIEQYFYSSDQRSSHRVAAVVKNLIKDFDKGTAHF